MTRRRPRRKGQGSVYYDRTIEQYVAALDVSDGGPRRRNRESFDTRAEAEARLDTWLQLRDSARHVDGPLLADWLAEWQDSTEFLALAAATRVQYAQLTEDYIRGPLGAYRLGALTPKAIKRWLHGLMGGDREASRTVGLTRDVLRTALRLAVEEDLLERNPVSAVRLRHKPARAIRVLSQAEVQALIDEALPWMRTAIVLLTLCGLRRGELLGLKWDDIDWTGRFRVQRAIVAKVDRRDREPGPGVKKPKTTAGIRIVPLPALALEFLAAHRRRAELEHLVRRRKVPAWIFPSERGGFMSPRNFNRAYYMTRSRAGLSEDLRLHDLRHTAATALLALGIDEKVVAEWIGHRDPRTTRSIYQHPERTAQDQGAAAVSRHWSETLRPRVEPTNGSVPAPIARASRKRSVV